jgi:hypothetical protein
MAQMRSVVLLPAEAEEHASDHTARVSPDVTRKTWRVICGLIFIQLVTLILFPEVLMQLSRQSILLLGMAAVLGCSDSTGPTTVSVLYNLQSINGRPLPTYFTSGSGMTIVHGSLGLDRSGSAVLKQTAENNGVQNTFTLTYTYSIKNGVIHFEQSPPCGANANCAATPTGTIAGNTISLTMAQFSVDGAIVYDFRTIGLD